MIVKSLDLHIYCYAFDPELLVFECIPIELNELDTFALCRNACVKIYYVQFASETDFLVYI